MYYLYTMAIIKLNKILCRYKSALDILAKFSLYLLSIVIYCLLRYHTNTMAFNKLRKNQPQTPKLVLDVFSTVFFESTVYCDILLKMLYQYHTMVIIKSSNHTHSLKKNEYLNDIYKWINKTCIRYISTIITVSILAQSTVSYIH